MGVPYWRLSGFYFFYFLVVGTLLPFWSLYLQSLHFNPQQIGFTAAVITCTKILSPNIWAWLSDYTGKRLFVIRIGSVLSCLVFAGIFLGQNFIWICIVAFGFSFFWNAILSQFEVVTLAHLEGQPERYGQIRLWGSVSFIVAVVVLGVLFDHVAIRYLPLVMFFFLALISLSSFTIPDHAYNKIRASTSGFLQLVKQKQVLAFFLACLCLELSLGTYYTFFSVYLEGLGYSRTLIGFLWALGVIAEVGIFLVTHQLLVRVGVYRLFVLSLLATVIRWLLLAQFADVLPLLLVSQLLHACSYGTAHAASVEWMRRKFSAHQSHGLALYSASSFGVGGALGALISGYIWAWNNQAAFVVSAVIAGFGVLIAWQYLGGVNNESASG